MTRTKRRRPTASRTASKITGNAITPRVSISDDLAARLSLQSLDDLALHVDGAFVLIVQVAGGQYRRRCFLSVAAAQRAAERARLAGHNARVVLAELRPLYRVEATAKAHR